ncbi:MAG: hypothetical protein DRJ32_07920 [Thermoprotei archaeon]|nr:MAG: hypothetical protein DRJ32_07920 [Thermoprotei archaeon]
MSHVRLLVTVGKTPVPIEYTLSRIAGENAGNIYVYAILSEESQQTLYNVLAEAIRRYGDRFNVKQFIVEDPEDIEECLRVCSEAVMELLDDVRESGVQDVSRENIVVNYTGGTKPMSAALVAVVLNRLPHANLVYIGGKRDERGIVVSGLEKVVQENVLPISALFKAKEHYENFNINYAYILIKEAAERYGSQYYMALSGFLESLALRDIYDFKEACNVLNRFKRPFKLYTDRVIFPEDVVKFFTKASESVDLVNSIYYSLKQLRRLKEARNSEQSKSIIKPFSRNRGLVRGLEYLIAEVLLNIERRILTGELLIACVSTYRLYELLTQYRLIVKYGLSPTYVDWSEIPSDFIREYNIDTSEVKHLNLQTSFNLLNYYGDELVDALDSDLLRKLQFERNNSLIEHGFSEVDREVVENAIKDINGACRRVISGFDIMLDKLKFPKLTDEVLFCVRA